MLSDMRGESGERERFLAWLQRKLTKRRVPTLLSEQFGKEPNWAGRVAKGKFEVTFSTAIAIAKKFDTSLAHILREDVAPGFELIEVPSHVAEALRDPVTVGGVEALAAVDADYRRQTVQGLRMVAKLPLLSRSTAPTIETIREANTTQEPKRRRKP